MIVDIQTSNQQEQKGKKDNQTINNHFSRILKQKDMYCTNNNNNNLYSHYSGTKKGRRKKGLYTQFDSVCKDAKLSSWLLLIYK